MQRKSGFISISTIVIGAMLLSFGVLVATRHTRTSVQTAMLMDKQIASTFGSDKDTDDPIEGETPTLPGEDVESMYDYKINYYLQNLYADEAENSENYTLAETKNGKGLMNSTISPSVITYKGFVSPSVKSIELTENNLTINYYYKRDSYRFTLQKTPGVNTTGSSPTGTYYYGEEITIMAEPESTYIWSHWKSTDGNIGDQPSKNYTFKMPGNAITMMPIVTGKTYTITYDGNGGTWSGQPTWSETAKYGSSYRVWQNFFNYSAGYSFAGWNTKPDGSGDSWSTYIEQDITWLYDEDITLYAQWGDEIYTVTYDGNGGVGSMSPELIRYGHTYIAQENFGYTREGYVFSHWTEAPTGGTSWQGWVGRPWTWTYKKNITLYAQWLPCYTVTYNANGGTLIDDNKVVYIDPVKPYIGYQYAALSNMFERDGYKFIEWNESPDGTGVSWSGWIGRGWNWAYEKDITLYAIWGKS